MSEIKVIVNTTNYIDLGTLSNEERELLFENLAKENPLIDKFHFDTFAEVQSDMIKHANSLLKPNLKELLLRKIIQPSGRFNTTVIPIIPSLTTVQIKRREGGAPSKGFKSRNEYAFRAPKKLNIADSIKVRFDTCILSITQDGVDYIVPPNEEIDVVGISLNILCAQPNYAVGERFLPLTMVAIDRMDIAPRLILGNYTYQLSCSDLFTPPIYGLNIAGEVFDGPTRVMFNIDEERILRTLSAVFDYLAKFAMFAQSIDSARAIFEQVRKACGARKGIQPRLASLFKGLYEWEPAKYSAPPNEVLPDILKMLMEVHTGAFSMQYRTSLLNDLAGRGFLRVYHRALLHGKDDPEVGQLLDAYRARRARIEFQTSVKRAMLDESNRINMFKLTIESKLGASRQAAIDAQLKLNPAAGSKAENILALLKPQERKIVELEIERKDKYLEAVLNNKCPHVKLYNQFRRAQLTDIVRKTFNELRKFFAEGSGQIKCKQCGFDIMCPHLRDWTTLELAGRDFIEIKGKMTQYIDKTPLQSNYYCRLCGELISTLEQFGDASATRDPSSLMNEELKNLMWGEIAQLMKYMQFSALINISQLIVTIRDACYPYIFEIEKQILKSKTNSAEEIKAKKKLFITIYGLAYIINLIVSARNRTEISFKNAKIDQKHPIVDLIRHCINVIILSKNIIIREIPGMSNDLIKNKLIEAYKVMSSGGAVIIQYASDTEDLLTTLSLDPVYKYIYHMYICGQIVAGKPISRAPGDYVDKIEQILGPISKLEKLSDVFAAATHPTFDARWHLNEFDHLQPVGPQTNVVKVYAAAHRGYMARVYQYFVSKLANEPVESPKNTKDAIQVDAQARYVYKDSGDVELNVMFREKYQKQFEASTALVQREDLLAQYKKMIHMRNYYGYRHLGGRAWVRVETTLGRIYDEDGTLHRWDIYIVVSAPTAEPADKPADSAEITVRDIAKQIDAGTRFAGHIVDKKCSVCGIKYSQVDELSVAKITDSLDIKYTISNFFRFYENRCPKGALHEFAKVGDKCAKCGILQDVFQDTGSKAAMGYYRDYKAVYTRERDEFAGTQAIVFPAPKDILGINDKYALEYAQWTMNFGIIQDLAHKLKLNYRLFICLGAMEKQEYADILSGTYIPSEPNYRNDTRIYVLNTYIKNLLTEYNMIRFFHKVNKPPADLSQLIDDSGINKHRISELVKKLPDIYNDYNERFRLFHRIKKPREITNFCIQSFCMMCLQIYNDTDRDTMKIRHDFVNYIVKKILKNNELTTRAGPFNWALLYGDKEPKEKEYDTNLTEANERSAVDEELEPLDDVGDTNAPFTMDSFDVESDSEGESEENQVRVEGYSLD